MHRARDGTGWRHRQAASVDSAWKRPGPLLCQPVVSTRVRERPAGVAARAGTRDHISAECAHRRWRMSLIAPVQRDVHGRAASPNTAAARENCSCVRRKRVIPTRRSRSEPPSCVEQFGGPAAAAGTATTAASPAQRPRIACRSRKSSSRPIGALTGSVARLRRPVPPRKSFSALLQGKLLDARPGQRAICGVRWSLGSSGLAALSGAAPFAAGASTRSCSTLARPLAVGTSLAAAGARDRSGGRGWGFR